MKIICHRGNLYGPNAKEENTIVSINKCLTETNFDVEIDIHCVNDTIYLGHDLPTAKQLSLKDFANFFQVFKNRLWVHCKNIEALICCREYIKEYNYFGHSNDEGVLTSKGYIFTRPGVCCGKGVICVMPELLSIDKKDIINCEGILTDFPFLYS